MGLFTPFAYIKNQVATFNPNDIANLTFWIDFSDSSFYTLSGTDITEVYSKVGGATSHTLNRVNASNNFYTLADSLSNSALKSAKVVTRPTTYRASSWNTADNNAIVFGPKTDTTSNPDGTMFAVYNRGTISTAGYLISRYTGTVDRGVQYNLATGTPQTDIIGYDQNLPTYQYYNTSTTANTILARVNNGTTSTIYNNGEIESTGTRNDAQTRTTRQFHNLGLFGSPTAVGETTPANVQYCEVIIYNRVLTENEIAVVNAYLSTKWNIALKSPDVITNNLVSFYDAGNLNSYIGSGTTWNSNLVTTNPFTLTNGPTFSTNNGGTIVFDGVNDYATRATFSSLNFGTGDFAIEAWVKITGNTSPNTDGIRDATIFAAFPDSGTLANSYAFSITGNTTTTGTGLVFGARDSVSTFQLPALTFSFTQNVFYQIGITHIAGVTRFFVNGTSYAASSNLSINLQTGTRPLQIGRLGYGAGYAQSLVGTIGIVRIYSGGGLTDAQILQNYNANSNRI